MPRTPHQPAELGDSAGPMPDGHAITLAEERETADIERDAAFEAAKTVGQIEALLFSATVAEKAIVETFLKLKQNKAYRAIQFRDDAGNLRRVADLGEFCERFLKKSYRRVQEMASNYHLIGADLYEAAEQIGFRQKDYAALKGLPSDDQEVIKQAIAADDRDQVIGLLQEMAARHASEKAALTAKATEAEETAEARDSVIQVKQAAIGRLEEDLHKARRRLASATPDEVGEQLCQETAGIGWSIVGLVNVDLAKAFAALDEHARANGCTHDEFMSGVLFEIERALGAIRENHNVKARPDGDPRPDWTRPDFDASPSDEMKAAMAKFEKEHGYNPLEKAGNA